MNQPEMRKAHVTKERDVRIHADLWHTANCLLMAGQNEPNGSAHQFRASLIFRAFALEALLNWLGQHLIAHWSYLERLKPREKLELLTDIIGVSSDYGSAPWQIVRELFAFRNYIAHGKPESLLAESMEPFDDFLDGKLGDLLETKWEQFSTEGNAVKAKEDVEKIAVMLYENAKIEHKGPLGPFSFGFQVHSAGL